MDGGKPGDGGHRLTLSTKLQLASLRATAARRWRDVASGMVNTVVGMATLAIIFPITTRAFGTETYGEYTTLYLVSGLVGLWVHSGTTAAIVQLIMQQDHDTDHILRVAHRQIRFVGLPTAFVGLVVSVLLLGRSALVPAIIVMGAEFLISALNAVNMATVLAIEGVTRTNKIALVPPFVRLAAVLLLALVDQVTLVSMVIANLTGAAAMLVLSSRAVRTRSPELRRGTQFTSQRQLARYTTMYATTMSTNVVQAEGEKFVLSSTRSTAELGQYAAASRVVGITALPLGPLMGAANRWSLERSDKPGINTSRAARLTIVAVAYGVVAAACILVFRDLALWLVGDEFDEVTTIVAWSAAIPMAAALADIPAMGLIALGLNRQRMFMGFGTSAVALVAYLALVPPFGWRGAVLGTYISEFTCVAVGWVLLLRGQRLADRARELATPEPSES